MSQNRVHGRIFPRYLLKICWRGEEQIFGEVFSKISGSIVYANLGVARGILNSRESINQAREREKLPQHQIVRFIIN